MRAALREHKTGVAEQPVDGWRWPRSWAVTVSNPEALGGGVAAGDLLDEQHPQHLGGVPALGPGVASTSGHGHARRASASAAARR